MLTVKPNAIAPLAASLAWFCDAQQIPQQQLANTLEISPQVFGGIMRGEYIADSLTAEALMRIYWILGLNEADPTRFDWPATRQVEWIQQNAAYVADKRREVYCLALTNQRINAQNEYGWIRALCMLFLIVLIGALLGIVVVGTSSKLFIGILSIAAVSSLLFLGTLMGLSVRRGQLKQLEQKV